MGSLCLGTLTSLYLAHVNAVNCVLLTTIVLTIIHCIIYLALGLSDPGIATSRDSIAEGPNRTKYQITYSSDFVINAIWRSFAEAITATNVEYASKIMTTTACGPPNASVATIYAYFTYSTS
jgi:hypothetical protein